MIRFHGTITRENYLRALALHGITKIRRVLMGCVAVFLLYGVVLEPVRQGQVGLRLVFPLIVVLFVVLLILFGPGITASRTFKTSKLMQGPRTGEVDETSVRQKTPFGSNELPWTLFVKSRSSDQLVLLYSAANQFFIFPREWFETSDDWAIFRKWAQEKTPQSTASTMVWAVRIILLLIGVIVLVLLVYEYLRPPEGERNRQPDTDHTAISQMTTP